jgi:hypothetical protein
MHVHIALVDGPGEPTGAARSDRRRQKIVTVRAGHVLTHSKVAYGY